MTTRFTLKKNSKFSNNLTANNAMGFRYIFHLKKQFGDLKILSLYLHKVLNKKTPKKMRET